MVGSFLSISDVNTVRSVLDWVRVQCFTRCLRRQCVDDLPRPAARLLDWIDCKTDEEAVSNLRMMKHEDFLVVVQTDLSFPYAGQTT